MEIKTGKPEGKLKQEEWKRKYNIRAQKQQKEKQWKRK